MHIFPNQCDKIADMITKTIVSSVIKGGNADQCGINAILAVDRIIQIGCKSASAFAERNKELTASSDLAEASNDHTDRKVSDLPVQIFGLAEGIMNGATGKIAAATAVEALLFDTNEYVRKLNRMELDIADFADLVSENADHAVRQQLTAWQGMQTGASLAWILIENDVAYTYSVGDATLALYREDKLYRITEQIDRETILSQDLFLGYRSKEARLMPANLNRMPLNKGDIILLMSSAISEVISDDEIAEIVARPEAFAAIADSLCDAAGGQDNSKELAVISVKVHAIEEQPSAPLAQTDTGMKKSRLKKIIGKS